MRARTASPVGAGARPLLSPCSLWKHSGEQEMQGTNLSVVSMDCWSFSFQFWLNPLVKQLLRGTLQGR